MQAKGLEVYMDKIEILVENCGKEMPTRKFGIFFEDLSHAADGGYMGSW